MSERYPTPEAPSSRELIETLLTMPGDIGNTYNRFYRYTPRNMAYLALQQCPLEPVATYKRWQSLGRQVLKGERAFYVLRPIDVKVRSAADDDDSDEEVTIVRRFKPVKALFAYSQTEGEELPPQESPSHWSVERALGALAIVRVPFEEYNGNVQGYSFERKIALNPMVSDPLATALHEIGHIENGHTSGSSSTEAAFHQGAREFEAEATASVTLNALGEFSEERASESRAYVQGWMRSKKPTEKSLRSILNASTRILNAGMEPMVELPE